MQSSTRFREHMKCLFELYTFESFDAGKLVSNFAFRLPLQIPHFLCFKLSFYANGARISSLQCGFLQLLVE